MSRKPFKKEVFIRELLLKTVGTNPDLFSYYVGLMEAKELLGKNTPENKSDFQVTEKPKRIITDC